MPDAPQKLDYVTPEPGSGAGRDWITIGINLALLGMLMIGGAFMLYVSFTAVWGWVPSWANFSL